MGAPSSSQSVSLPNSAARMRACARFRSDCRASWVQDRMTTFSRIPWPSRRRRTAYVRNPDALFNNVVHIDDLARFAETLLETLPPGHQATTIAAADPLPIREVVGLLQTAARPGRRRPLPSGRAFIPDLERTCADAWVPAGDRARCRATLRNRVCGRALARAPGIIAKRQKDLDAAAGAIGPECDRNALRNVALRGSALSSKTARGCPATRAWRSPSRSPALPPSNR